MFPLQRNDALPSFPFTSDIDVAFKASSPMCYLEAVRKKIITLGEETAAKFPLELCGFTLGTRQHLRGCKSVSVASEYRIEFFKSTKQPCANASPRQSGALQAGFYGRNKTGAAGGPGGSRQYFSLSCCSSSLTPSLFQSPHRGSSERQGTPVSGGEGRDNETGGISKLQGPVSALRF